METKKTDLIIPSISIALIASLIILFQGVQHLLSL